MSDSTSVSVPEAGWYPDRNEADTVRWWDGQQWTDQTQSTAPAAAAFEQPVSSAAFGFGTELSLVAATPGTTPAAPGQAALSPYAGSAAATAAAGIAPGWYPDNYDRSLQRWWDGREWTAHTSPAASLAAGAEPVSSASNTMATLAMILSIVSFAGLVVPALLVIALAGVIVGIVALRRARRFAPGAARRGQAIAGIVVGSVSLIMTVLLTIIAVVVYLQVHPVTGSQAAGQQSNSQSDGGTTGDGDSGVGLPSTISELKQVIATSVERNDAVTVTSVTCDAAASMLAGSTFVCGVGVSDGRWAPIRVNILQPTGSGMSYGLGFSPLLANNEAAMPSRYTLDQLESELRANLVQAWGSEISDLACDSAASMADGSTFQCTITLVNGNTGVVLISMVAPDGYDVSVLDSPLGSSGSGGSGGSNATDPNPDLSNS